MQKFIKMVVIGKSLEYPAKEGVLAGDELLIENVSGVLKVSNVGGEPVGRIINIKHPNILESNEDNFVEQKDLVERLPSSSTCRVIDTREVSLKSEPNSKILICELVPVVETEVATVVEEEMETEVEVETEVETEVEVGAKRVALYTSSPERFTLADLEVIICGSKAFDELFVVVPGQMSETVAFMSEVIKSRGLENTTVITTESSIDEFMNNSNVSAVIKPILKIHKYKTQTINYDNTNSDIQVHYFMTNPAFGDVNVKDIQGLLKI